MKFREEISYQKTADLLQSEKIVFVFIFPTAELWFFHKKSGILPQLNFHLYMAHINVPVKCKANQKPNFWCLFLYIFFNLKWKYVNYCQVTEMFGWGICNAFLRSNKSLFFHAYLTILTNPYAIFLYYSEVLKKLLCTLITFCNFTLSFIT